MKMRYFLLTATLLVELVCAEAKEITFTEHVAPIIFQNCTSCHRPGEAGPFALMSYNDVRKRGKLIQLVTEDRIMPPWHAQKSAFKFHGDRRLSEEQISTIADWVESGMPEGDHDKLPSLPKFIDGWQLGKPDMVVKMSEPFPVPDEGRDIYRSFVIPLDLPEGKWLKAIEFRPDARSVVHHCLFFYDTTGEARRLDKSDPRPGFRRMRQQGRGIGPLGGWAVGGQPEKLPEDLAYYLPKEADLVLSMHYHPSGKPERDQSSVGLYFTDQKPSTSFTGVQLPPAFGALNRISIPAGEKAYTVTDEFTLPIDVEAFAVSAHAHYLGKQLRMTATLPEGETLDLLIFPTGIFHGRNNINLRSSSNYPAALSWPPPWCGITLPKIRVTRISRPAVSDGDQKVMMKWVASPCSSAQPKAKILEHSIHFTAFMWDRWHGTQNRPHFPNQSKAKHKSVAI